MLTKFKELQESHEEGFTLIELLVVILIIGILSAIAIPAFLNQRKAAVDASIESDVSNAAKELTNVALKQPTLTPDTINGNDSTGSLGFILPMNLASGIAPASNGSSIYPGVKVSSGNTLIIKPAQEATDYGQFCIYGVASGGDKYSSDPVTYDSMAGGLNKTGGACAVDTPSDVVELIANGGKPPAGGGGNVEIPSMWWGAQNEIYFQEYDALATSEVVSSDGESFTVRLNQKNFEKLPSDASVSVVFYATTKSLGDWGGFGTTTQWQYDKNGDNTGILGENEYKLKKSMDMKVFLNNSNTNKQIAGVGDIQDIYMTYTITTPDGGWSSTNAQVFK